MSETFYFELLPVPGNIFSTPSKSIVCLLHKKKNIPMQNVSGHPQVVAGLDALTRSHLELPLRGHDLGVAPADLDARVQTGLVVGVGDVAAVRAVGADRAVVGALRHRVAVGLRPAERPAVSVQQAVLLLQAEPGHGLFGKVHDSLAVVSLVRFW